MGEEDNTKTSYSQMFKLRIHLAENEQKPFNGNLQETVTHWVTCYLLPFKNLSKNFFKKRTAFSSSSLLFLPHLCAGIVVVQMHIVPIQRTNSAEKQTRIIFMF